jgi:hypothetical protein
MEDRGARRDAIRNELAEELSRRQFLGRAGALGLGAVVVSALPAAARLVTPEVARAQLPLGDLADGTLQAFFDTIIPGRPASVTELGNAIHPQAIAGVDPEPGAVEADALLLAHNAKIGFDTLEPAFLADLELRSLTLAGGQFLDLSYDAREGVAIAGLDFGNSSRVVWEAAAAVPFTAFCAAANTPNATAATAVGYDVMGHPGTAPRGYKSFSYKRRLNRGRTKGGSLP